VAVVVAVARDVAVADAGRLGGDDGHAEDDATSGWPPNLSVRQIPAVWVLSRTYRNKGLNELLASEDEEAAEKKANSSQNRPDFCRRGPMISSLLACTR